MKTIKAKIHFTERLLGTANNNPEIHSEFIASKAPDALSRKEEVEAIGADEVIEKGMTVFPKLDDGTPIFWDYQWKGFFKDTAKALKKATNTKSAGLKAYKQEIDGLIFVNPRRIPIHTDSAITNCERPLRASTAQGERMALANSETIEAGAWCEFKVICHNDADEKLVREWLDFGVWRGMGAWRNASNGRFYWEEIGEDGSVIYSNADTVQGD